MSKLKIQPSSKTSKFKNNVIAEPIVESYNKEQMDKDKRRVIFKNYKKLLTAQLNDISYIAGYGWNERISPSICLLIRAVC